MIFGRIALRQLIDVLNEMVQVMLNRFLSPAIPGMGRLAIKHRLANYPESIVKKVLGDQHRSLTR